MKNYLSIVLIAVAIFLTSCSSDDNQVKTITMRINHYQNTGMAVAPVLTLLVQEENMIGTDNWNRFYSNIEGFNYEPGRIYNLSVLVEEVSNPPADGSTLKYTLLKIESIEEVNNETPFDIDLKIIGQNFVTTTSSAGYELLNQIEIDCNTLCNELDTLVQNQDAVVGTFKRLPSNAIQLIGLK